jgi:glycerol 3-phosphatase-2
VSDTLVARYAAVVCDLDGVVYRGPTAVPHAVEALSALEVPVIFATNNASRTAEDVSGHLRELGVECTADDVATSAQAAAWVLSDHLETGAAVLAVGGEGVAVALRRAGLTPVLPADASETAVRAVVQGYGPSVSASDLAEAAYAIENGARWVATNTDTTLPTDRGLAPGNGSLVGAVALAVGHDPHVVAGKPEAPLYELCAERLGLAVGDVLAVGDRLSTDIAGAVAAGMDSLLVLTGIDGLDELLAANPEQRPTWVAADLRALHRAPDADGDRGTEAVARAVAAVHAAVDTGAADDELERLRRAARDLLDDGPRG